MEYQGRGRKEESWGWKGVVRVGEKTRKVEEGGKARKRRRGPLTSVAQWIEHHPAD